MTLTIEGAGLLAQLIPVGILILAVEARAVSPTVRRWPIWMRVPLGLLAAAVVLVALPAVYYCFLAVNIGASPSEFHGGVIVAGATAVYALAGTIVAMLAYAAFVRDE